MTTPSWTDALPANSTGAKLVELWMTTFDAPDPGLLVDHLLPALLAYNRGPSAELAGRAHFFGELGMALEELRGRVTLVSSPASEPRTDAPYPWLWRYVDHFTVGMRGPAVQHAKLWAFHWQSPDAEWLELHVTSINLTTAAFRSQLQAGWRVEVQLGEQSTQAGRRSWGELVPFLEQLGASAGRIATERMQRLIHHLGRTTCPEGVTFIASIPGTKSAARQLAQFEPSRLYMLTPTIGEWREAPLAAFAKDAGLVPDKLQLAWLSGLHPWAQRAGWSMTEATYHALGASDVKLQCIPHAERLHREHRDEDERWSHAKLYLVRSRRRRYLLVTSANWSVSAWGAGKSSPRNFELGVLFQTEWDALETLGEPFGDGLSPHLTERSDDDLAPSVLEWAEASWDGRTVTVQARSARADLPMAARVFFDGADPAELTLAEGTASMPWTSAEQTPVEAVVTQGRAQLRVAVLDLRDAEAFRKTPLPEIDPAVAQAMRDALLLQRYGGPAVEPEAVLGLVMPKAAPQSKVASADYMVQAWRDARAAFRHLDCWRDTLAEAGDPARRARVMHDGHDLLRILRRDAKLGVSLAVDELTWRLEEET